MAVTIEALYSAEMAFRQAAQPATAACFLSKLREAEEIGAISADRFHDGLALIEEYLWKGGSVVHGVVSRVDLEPPEVAS